jgi:hypothetical protein
VSLPGNWQTTFEAEILQAEQARLAGNEGMARVCARRAAGAAAGEYFRRQGIDMDSPSAYDRLRYLGDLGNISPQARQATEHLLRRLTPEFTLPVQADLIAEARLLRQELLGE